MYRAAQIKRAEMLNEADAVEEAISVLYAVMTDTADDIEALVRWAICCVSASL